MVPTMDTTRTIQFLERRAGYANRHGTHHGSPSAVWTGGATPQEQHGVVDVFVHACCVRVDVRPVGGPLPWMIVSETSSGMTAQAAPSLSSPEEIFAHAGAWPVSVPEAVAVEVAVRALAFDAALPGRPRGPGAIRLAPSNLRAAFHLPDPPQPPENPYPLARIVAAFAAEMSVVA